MNFNALMTIFLLGIIFQAQATTTASPDTWSYVDGLGRKSPDQSSVPSPRPRAVGIFYFLLHGNHQERSLLPINMGEISKHSPQAILDPNTSVFGRELQVNYFAEPLLGFYTADDEWVYERHARMLSEAGVDTLIFDTTNAHTYPESLKHLITAFKRVRAQGGQTPQFANMFMFDDANGATAELIEMYETIYKKNIASELWYRWKGKPLALINPAFVTEQTIKYIKDNIDTHPSRHLFPNVKNSTVTAAALQAFFTMRAPKPDYFSAQYLPQQWSWSEVAPQHVFSSPTSAKEQMSVSVAQNSEDGYLTLFSNGAVSDKVTGRSWTSKGSKKAPGSAVYGYNFQEQFDLAIANDPEFILITGWNEFEANRYIKDGHFTHQYWNTKAKVGNIFVDTYNDEYSRDIEPTTGDLKDHYYYQLVTNIRRYKGTQKIDPAGQFLSIDVKKGFDQWNAVPNQYLNSVGTKSNRQTIGLGNINYVNNSVINRIVSAKVANDSNNIYFYLKTQDPIIRSDSNAWMNLLIRTEKTHFSWDSFHYVVNYPQGRISEVLNGGSTTPIGDVNVEYYGNELMLSIPASTFKVSAGDKISFKWADNALVSPTNSGLDIMNVYNYGDTAPSGRFTFDYVLASNNSLNRIPLTSVESNDELWSAKNVIDGNYDTTYTSHGYPGGLNKHLFLASWINFNNGPKRVDSVKLKARMVNGTPVAFPKKYKMYVTTSNNNSWQFLGDYTSGPTAANKGLVEIKLPQPVITFGVMIVPTELGRDDYNNQYFQLSEIELWGK